MDNTAEPKKTYEAPALQVEGTVQDLTLGNTTGNYTDKSFPAGTPIGKLTFSG